MPYIRQPLRKYLVPDSVATASDPGELNFQITSLCDRYINRTQQASYVDINDAIGALECAKLELYRRIAAPYEDKKIAENGDVY